MHKKDVVHDELISIAMCTYNGELYLEEQLKSLTNQSYNPLELIISDDCSSDNSWDILSKYQQEYPEMIKIFRNEQNIGYNKNFEKAIKECNGKYIAISDQDDIWEIDKICSLHKILMPKGNILAHCSSINFSDHGMHSDNRKWSYLFSGNDIREFVFKNQISGHNMLFKKELVDKIIPIPDGVIYDWWIAACATCYGNIVALPKIMVRRRIHSKNAFRSIKHKKIDKLQRLLAFTKAINKYPTVPSLYQEFVEQSNKLVEKKFIHHKGSFDRSLFNFLYINRNIIFKYKKRNSWLSKRWSMFKAAFSISSY